jgi:hypothetical protein
MALGVIMQLLLKLFVLFTKLLKKMVFISFLSPLRIEGSPILIDPHTAVGKHVADEYRNFLADTTVPLVISSTAHYAKFPTAILEALQLGASETSVQAQINTIGEFVTKENASPVIHKDVLAACNSNTTRYAVIQPSINVLKITVQDFVNTLVQEKLL